MIEIHNHINKDTIVDDYIFKEMYQFDLTVWAVSVDIEIFSLRNRGKIDRSNLFQLSMVFLSSKWKFEFTGPNQNLKFILYLYLNKNWKMYWSKQSFSGLGPENQCSSRGLVFNPCLTYWSLTINVYFHRFDTLQTIFDYISEQRLYRTSSGSYTETHP